jgi:hypothetical protein
MGKLEKQFELFVKTGKSNAVQRCKIIFDDLNERYLYVKKLDELVVK